MVKVLRVIARLNIGGPAIHTILLSSELNKRGYKDILVTGKVSESEGDMEYLAKSQNVMPIIVSELGREISIRKDWRAFLELYRIMKKERPDIVHTHTAKAGTLGRIAALLAGVPVRVHTFHGHIFDGYFSPAKARFFLFVERFLALFTDRVIVVSKEIKNDITTRLKVTSQAQSVVIPLGLELGKFIGSDRKAGSFRKTLGLTDDVMLIGIIGRLVPIKNHSMFLEVARKVRDSASGMKIRFLVIGDGEMREALEGSAKLQGLEGFVAFTGWIEDLASVYADLDIVALTSLNEGTPVSIIESMAAGKPVVVTDVGGVRDLVRNGENGFLTRSGDVEDFASKLLILLKDSDKRKLFGINGRKAVASKYSKERLVEDIDSLYRELLNKKTRI